ncbi:MAG TPA: carboxy terminal-processing peptidase [Gammaproteobacteria bacterium]|nr:carboxy terminal-processing peptidase [Gammaproteobacteria bacterium]
MRRLLIVLSIALAPLAAAAATPAPAAATALAPQARQVLIARTVVEVMQSKHYPAKPLDDKFAQALLDQYFDDLDPGRFYFTQADIDRFHRYDGELADDLKHGNLEPAFAIYRVYARQVRRQIQDALQLLASEPALGGDETYQFTQPHSPWPKDQKALDEAWQKRATNDVITLMLAGKNWDETKKVLTKRYQYVLNVVNRTTSNDVFDAFMNAYAETQDPHSAYFSPFEAQQFQIAMSLHLEGIGAQLSDSDGYVTVVRILPGGPAAKSGELKSGDRIVGVGEGAKGKIVDVVGWRLDDVVKKIRGPKGSAVRLEVLPAGVLPGGMEKTITFIRNTIELEAERASAKTMFVKRGDTGYRIGVITIPSFYLNFQAEDDDDQNYASVSRDVAALVTELKKGKVSGILLDLRGDGGGSLEEAAAVTGLFIPSGPVVQVQDRSGRVQQLGTPRGEKIVWDGPLAVLVDRFSASATEIFAGALKDYQRALVLGSPTWGKGTVQQLLDLDNYLPGFKAGEVKLTTAQFFRVNGSSTQRKGVLPDIALPSAIDDSQFGEATYPNALPWKRIAPADYAPVNDAVDATLAGVERYFETTVKDGPRFQLYQKEVAIERAMAARDTVALNLEKRQSERAAERSQKLQLDNAWRKLNGHKPFTSLKQAGADSFSPPDVALEASGDILGEYIALAAPLVSRFHPAPAASAAAPDLCLTWSATERAPTPVAQPCKQPPAQAATAASATRPRAAGSGG